jgi:hypothetical protein
MIPLTELVAQLQGDLAKARTLLQHGAQHPEQPLDQTHKALKALLLTMLKRYAQAKAERLRLAIRWCRDHRPEDEPDDKLVAEFLLYLGDLDLTVGWLSPAGSDLRDADIGELVLLDENVCRRRMMERGQRGAGVDAAIDHVRGRDC